MLTCTFQPKDLSLEANLERCFLTSFPLKYGTGCFDFTLQGAEHLSTEVTPPESSPEDLVRSALSAPLGSPPIGEICTPGEKVVIVTSDITRYTGSEHYLPVLVETLNGIGIPDEDIEILIALGIHRKQTEEEHRKILGPLFGRIEVTDHECDEPTELATLGTTSSGVPVSVNRRVVEADRVIVTGTAGYHYFAGFGGGRKGLVPGVASRETCMASHFAIFNPPEIGGKNPLATAGILNGNPVHQALLEAARLVTPDFILNTVLSPDKKLLDVFCGELEKAHLAACTLVDRLYSYKLKKPGDLAVVSCGGSPKDINFIQAHKSLDYGVRAIKKGGTLILLAECPDGFGNSTFFSWFRHRNLDEFEKALRQGYEINGQTAYATLCKTLEYRIILVSNFSEEETRRMGMTKAADLNEAMHIARKDLPENPHILVIPDGGTILPLQ